MRINIALEKYTDFIPDTQLIQYWAFDFKKLISYYDSDNYTVPVYTQLFKIFSKMNQSLNICI